MSFEEMWSRHSNFHPKYSIGNFKDLCDLFYEAGRAEERKRCAEIARDKFELCIYFGQQITKAIENEQNV